MSEHRRSKITAIKHWATVTFTREKLVDAVKSFLWVAPLTLLIWIYAEREQINSDFAVNNVAIQLVNNDPARFVEVDKSSPSRVNLTLSGPLSNLENVRKELATDGMPIDIGKLLGPGNGQRSVNVVDRIQDDPRLREAGISVVASQPTELTINVDAMQHAQVDVKTTVTNLDMSKTWFDPKQVTISGPESSFKDLSRLIVRADLTGSPTLGLPGPHELSDIPLVLDQADQLHITISPPTVKAHLEVLSTDVTWQIVSIPIVILASPNLLEKYYVEVTPASVANVKVEGPPALKDKEVAIAELDISNKDEGFTDVPRKLDFRFAPGIHLAPDDTASQQPVKFTLVLRTPSTGG